MIFLQRFSCNACTVEAGSHSSRSSRRIAGRDRAAGQSGQDGRRGGGSSSETRGAFRASARRRTDHQHATGGPRQVRAELQYWVLVLVLELYLSTGFRYWYWYLQEMYRLYVPVPGNFFGVGDWRQHGDSGREKRCCTTVSYTHLTLPTTPYV